MDAADKDNPTEDEVSKVNNTAIFEVNYNRVCTWAEMSIPTVWPKFLTYWSGLQVISLHTMTTTVESTTITTDREMTVVEEEDKMYMNNSLKVIFKTMIVLQSPAEMQWR